MALKWPCNKSNGIFCYSSGALGKRKFSRFISRATVLNGSMFSSLPFLFRIDFTICNHQRSLLTACINLISCISRVSYSTVKKSCQGSDRTHLFRGCKEGKMNFRQNGARYQNLTAPCLSRSLAPPRSTSLAIYDSTISSCSQ